MLTRQDQKKKENTIHGKFQTRLFLSAFHLRVSESVRFIRRHELDIFIHIHMLSMKNRGPGQAH